uniref:LIM zinc-binding domain-containing protein n=2 Tax=Callorhinchus milii TaxID=7868 RepID=A0A4W3HTW9_CALMI
VNQLTADKPRTLSSFQCIICHSNLSLNGYASMKGDFYCIPHFQQLLKSEGFHGEEFKPEQ